jgi:hypothetical protein
MKELQEKLVIIASNYWENFKFLQDLGRSLPHDNPRLLKLQKECNEQAAEMNELKKKIMELSGE